jgi:uncharacterized protein (TIGR04255 family)
MVEDTVAADVPPTKTLQEFVLAGHLQAPLPLGVLDVADWVTRFADFPIVQELPSLPAFQMPVSGQPQMSSVEFNMGTPLPRMLLRSIEGRYSVQLQGDRFAIGWARIEPIGGEAPYPGFDAMVDIWTEMSGRYEAWALERFRSLPQFRLMELTYVNAAPLELEGKKKRLSEIFRFVQPGTRPVNSFTVQWAESLHKDDRPGQPFRGIVNSVVAVGEAASVPVLGFNFSGIGAVAEGQESKHIVSDLHARIREIYQSAFIIDAH